MRQARAGEGYQFIARLRDGDPDIVAPINLRHIIRGVMDGAMMGYSIDARHQGRGLAYEAVGAVVHYGFDTLRLHRIAANYQPSNERSGALLRRLGFAVEGYARDYLYINGAWRDHILTARINPAWQPA